MRMSSGAHPAATAAAVKLLFFHQLMRAATVVMPAVTSCSTVVLSMGSTGLPIALST